jgi:hypothetical protein
VVQSTQTSPDPHVVEAVPSTHVLVINEQQLPLHIGASGSQLVEHRLVMLSQALAIGQSLGALQPQKPPFVVGWQT